MCAFAAHDVYVVSLDAMCGALNADGMRGGVWVG